METIKAEQPKAFSFKDLKISKFSYEESGNETDDLEMEFLPRGKYDENTGMYDLILNFNAVDKITAKKIIKIKAIGQFKFDNNYKFDELPDYFFTNSLPIMFPYVRAFISTLTLQANGNVIMLGLIKFSSISKPLKDNTDVILRS